jgi:hypothetical protein
MTTVNENLLEICNMVQAYTISETTSYACANCIINASLLCIRSLGLKIMTAFINIT